MPEEDLARGHKLNDGRLGTAADARVVVSCLCPNGHGQMQDDGPYAGGRSWKCAVCGIERMWPDPVEAALRGASPHPPADARPWLPIETYPLDSTDYVLLASPAHGRVIGAHVTGEVWHLIGVGAVNSESERPTHWLPLPTGPDQELGVDSTSPHQPDEDFATLLQVHGRDATPTRVAAFLRLYAGRIRQNERWDTNDTMAAAYEGAARALDAYMAEPATARGPLFAPETAFSAQPCGCDPGAHHLCREHQEAAARAQDRSGAAHTGSG